MQSPIKMNLHASQSQPAKQLKLLCTKHECQVSSEGKLQEYSPPIKGKTKSWLEGKTGHLKQISVTLTRAYRVNLRKRSSHLSNNKSRACNNQTVNLPSIHSREFQHHCHSFKSKKKSWAINRQTFNLSKGKVRAFKIPSVMYIKSHSQNVPIKITIHKSNANH